MWTWGQAAAAAAAAADDDEEEKVLMERVDVKMLPGL